VRRVLVNAAIDRRRWMRRRPEYLGGLAGWEPAQGDHSARVADRDLLMRGLARLPPRQRAVLVLWFWEDQDAAAIASVLGCGVGTVKSQLSRGLARLRQLAEFSGEPDQPTAGVGDE
jgi:RNA polymerase sigma factor (sigma-70 family)